MNETKIELSREGIALPYRRYLSDSAPGFILVLLTFLSECKLPPVKILLSDTVSAETRIFIFIILFLLSTPIGAVINVIGWMLLEPFQKRIEECLVRKGFGRFKEEYNFYECIKNKIGESNWFNRIRYLEVAEIGRHPSLVDRIESLRGISIFIRSLSLISFLYGVLQFRSKLLLSVFLLVGVFLLYVSAVVSFYFHVHILFWSCVLSPPPSADAQYAATAAESDATAIPPPAKT